MTDQTVSPEIHPAPHRRNAGLFSLGFGLAAAPLAWAAQSIIGYALSSYGCFLGPTSSTSAAVRRNVANPACAKCRRADHCGAGRCDCLQKLAGDARGARRWIRAPRRDRRGTHPFPRDVRNSEQSRISDRDGFHFIRNRAGTAMPLVARLMVTLAILSAPCAAFADGGNAARAIWEPELLPALLLTLFAILYGIGAVNYAAEPCRIVWLVRPKSCR